MPAKFKIPSRINPKATTIPKLTDRSFSLMEGYFTLNVTGSNASLTFTPQATPVQLTGPNILSIGKAANTVTLVWTTVPPHTYQLQYTASLQPTNWINIGSGTIANSAFMTNTDPAATAAIRFYRVTAQ